jgi:CheY-like chemotaxis protein
MQPHHIDESISSPLCTLDPAANFGGADLPEALPGSASARDLKDLLAVVIGVCESLADNLQQSPTHGQLARIGALAADRAAGLVTDLINSGVIPSPDTPLALPRPANGNGLKVLLVEDDPDLLVLLNAAFTREGFQTFSARNGRQGVQMLRSLQPDLMVTDIVMPEMEGIGAILEARRSGVATKVIAISGGGQYGRSQNFLEWARELGADEVLAKPFRMSSLITAARLVLDRPAADTGFEPRTPTRLAQAR